MANIPIALQLYSVRNEFKDDPAGTLKSVADMGYAGVEFAGPPQHDGETLRAMLDEAGLVCCGWHTPFNMVQDDALEATIALNKAVGNRFVIVPGIPAELRSSRADWLKLADFFNQLAEKLAPHGMVTGYHNHHVEFTAMDGELPWDTFFGNTREDVVMQLDTGNAILGGGDILDILKRYPTRGTTVHLKPYSKTAGKDDPHAGFRPVFGADDTPWEAVFSLCEKGGGTEWYIVEYESDAYPPMEAVDRCLQALRAMGK